MHRYFKDMVRLVHERVGVLTPIEELEQRDREAPREPEPPRKEVQIAYPETRVAAEMRAGGRFSFADSNVSLKSYEAPEDDGDRFDIHDRGDSHREPDGAFRGHRPDGFVNLSRLPAGTRHSRSHDGRRHGNHDGFHGRVRRTYGRMAGTCGVLPLTGGQASSHFLVSARAAVRAMTRRHGRSFARGGRRR